LWIIILFSGNCQFFYIALPAADEICPLALAMRAYSAVLHGQVLFSAVLAVCCRFEYFIIKLCIFERGIALSEIISAVGKVFRHDTGYLAYFERDCFNILYLLFLGYLLDGIGNIFYQENSSGVSALLLYDMNILIQDRAIGIKQLNNALVLRELEPSISHVFGLEYSDTLSDSEKQFVKFIRKRFEQKDNAE